MYIRYINVVRRAGRMRKNILKKMARLCALVMISMLTCAYKPAEGTGHPDEWEIDKNQYIYDYYNVFSESEELALQKMCEEAKAKLNMDVVIVCSGNLGGMHERDYADDFYDKGGYSESGVLYLIDLYHDGIWISTAGLAMVYIDDVDVENLLDEVWVGFEKYDYYKSACDFVETVEDMVGDRKKDDDFKEVEDLWYEGGYTDYEDFMDAHSDKVYAAYKENFFTPFKNPLLCLAAGGGLAFIVVLIMCISSGTKMTANSRTYMRNGSFNILHRFDRFTHTTTTSRKVSSSSGGGGGSRGHSSSHRSSSGRSHGGGGRRR